MKLTANQIKEIITGAVRIEEENGILTPCRFTKEQADWYEVTSPNFYLKSRSSAGVKLSFKTDSKNITLKVAVEEGVSRWYFSVDVLADGKAVGFIDNFSDKTLPENYASIELPSDYFAKTSGSFSGTFSLGEGVKTVCVHLPWSVRTGIEAIVLDDGAFIEAAKPEKKLLVYGDSITHGYDALRPSGRYIARLSERLGAEEINKAIGGETFVPPLAKLKDDFLPDLILVAYGTNDWFMKEADALKADCKGFFESLRQSYPETKIVAVTPIWRKDMEEDKPFGPFENVERTIRKATAAIENITVISGTHLVPWDESFYADLRLHPNDAGFVHYFENLYKEISKAV